VRLAVNEVECARQEIAASKTTRRLREEALQAEKGRFGVSTISSAINSIG
jgi:hypothetical protein